MNIFTIIMFALISLMMVFAIIKVIYQKIKYGRFFMENKNED